MFSLSAYLPSFLQNPPKEYNPDGPFFLSFQVDDQVKNPKTFQGVFESDLSPGRFLVGTIDERRRKIVVSGVSLDGPSSCVGIVKGKDTEDLRSVLSKIPLCLVVDLESSSRFRIFWMVKGAIASVIPILDERNNGIQVYYSPNVFCFFNHTFDSFFF